MPVCRVNLDESALLVIDMQEKLLPHIADHETITRRCKVLINGCRALGVPILVTEQYPKGLGPTVESIRSALPAEQAIHAKQKFSAWIEPVRQEIIALNRRTVLLCGIETHVCVLQTAMDLAEAGLMVAVAGDGVGSRRAEDKALAINRMRDFGVIVASTEMLLLEMVREAGTERFKKIAPIIR